MYKKILCIYSRTAKDNGKKKEAAFTVIDDNMIRKENCNPYVYFTN